LQRYDKNKNIPNFSLEIIVQLDYIGYLCTSNTTDMGISEHSLIHAATTAKNKLGNKNKTFVPKCSLLLSLFRGMTLTKGN